MVAGKFDWIQSRCSLLRACLNADDLGGATVDLRLADQLKFHVWDFISMYCDAVDPEKLPKVIVLGGDVAIDHGGVFASLATTALKDLTTQPIVDGEIGLFMTDAAMYPGLDNFANTPNWQVVNHRAMMAGKFIMDSLGYGFTCKNFPIALVRHVLMPEREPVLSDFADADLVRYLRLMTQTGLWALLKDWITRNELATRTEVDSLEHRWRDGLKADVMKSLFEIVYLGGSTSSRVARAVIAGARSSHVYTLVKGWNKTDIDNLLSKHSITVKHFNDFNIRWQVEGPLELEKRALLARLRRLKTSKVGLFQQTVTSVFWAKPMTVSIAI